MSHVSVSVKQDSCWVLGFKDSCSWRRNAEKAAAAAPGHPPLPCGKVKSHLQRIGQEDSHCETTPSSNSGHCSHRPFTSSLWDGVVTWRSIMFVRLCLLALAGVDDIFDSEVQPAGRPEQQRSCAPAVPEAICKSAALDACSVEPCECRYNAPQGEACRTGGPQVWDSQGRGPLSPDFVDGGALGVERGAPPLQSILQQPDL